MTAPTIETSLLFLATLCVGAIGSWLLRAREVALLSRALAEEKSRVAELAVKIACVESDAASTHTDLAVANEKVESLRQFDDAMSGKFAIAAQGALENASRMFLELASAKLGQEQAAMAGSLQTRVAEIKGVLSPVQDEFARFRQAVDALQKNTVEDLGQLRSTIQHVVQMQGALQDAVRATNDATGKLQTALQNPRIAGNWGEISLDRIVAIAGMTEYCDFDRQVGMRSSDGTLEKPDLTIHLTGGLNIPVDAKASTANYIRAVGEQDDSERRRLLKQSALDLKGRVTDLRTRNYDRIQGYAGLTILYVPNESMLSSALSQEQTLIEDALGDGIVICSPLLLLCYLRAFANGWRIQKQQENAEEVARRGKMLHDRMQTFFTVLAKVGKYLNHTVEKYNECIGKIDNLLVPGRELGKLLGLTEELDPIDSVDTSVRETKFSRGTDGPAALADDAA